MKNKNERLKKFGLSNWSVANYKTVFLITVMIVIGGLGSYLGMPKENFPEMEIPEIYIGIASPGSSPEVIAKEITKPIESELQSLKNVDEINSTSVFGYTTIRVKFNFSVDNDKIVQEVKDAVDRARAETDFPELLTEPSVIELDPANIPILNVNLRGPSPKELKRIAEDLEEKMEDLSEVSEVVIRGVQEEEMRIEVDRLKAEAVNVSIDDIELAVASENVTVSGGELLSSYGVRKSIRIEGEFKSPQELEEIIVKQDDYKPVFLKDIARVYFGSADTVSYSREWGEDVVMLDIKKQAGKNLLVAVDQIKTLINESIEDGTIPSDVIVSFTNDQSNNTRSMISDLVNSIIFGIILVVLVLLFFIGIRNAIFVGLAIPLSMFMSFLILSTFGVTLNVMVLFSLVLALGMLVDNGIVVIENIYRLQDQGMSPLEAAKAGVGEVALPIIASTATTLAAFVPLALWPGLMGEFMKFLPITLMIVLGSSLFVALVINPAIAAIFMRKSEKKRTKHKPIIVGCSMLVIGLLFLFFVNNTAGNIIIVGGIFIVLERFALTPLAEAFQSGFLPRIESLYLRFLKFTLDGRKPQLFFLGTIGLLIFSFLLLVLFPPKVLFFSENEPNYVNIFIAHPAGTDIRKTNETTLQVEKKLDSILSKYLENDKKAKNQDEKIIQSVIAQVGKGTSDPSQGLSLEDTPHKARIVVQFAEYQHRKGVATLEILKEIAALKHDFPADVEISAAKNAGGPPLPPPISIEIFGSKPYDVLLAEAEKIRGYLSRKNVKGVDKLKLDVESGKAEFPIIVNREKARTLNVSTSQIALAIRKALFGQEIGTYRKEDDTYKIRVRFDRNNRNNLDALLDQKLVFRDNNGKLISIPIRSLVLSPKEQVSCSAVIRKDQIPTITISSDVIGANPQEVVSELKNHMKTYEEEIGLINGAAYNFTGQQEEQAKEMDFLSNALLVALFLILTIIVTQFNSYSTPVIILFSVIFSLIGVLLGLIVTGEEFVIIMTMIGIISLTGVVVNNSIVLIDYTNLLMSKKKAELGLDEESLLPFKDVVESIVEGGRTRLRPVLLTAITTILGLVPLAHGINIDFASLLAGEGANFYLGGDNNVLFGPMSKAIIYGLTFATFLTLVMVPAMFLILYKIKIKYVVRPA